MATEELLGNYRERMGKIKEEYHEALASMLTVLNSKMRLGGAPQLGELVMRLNFNGFY